ncbi:MAG TPA: sigma-70 family RNA polymerase sigma factor [Thermoanaerobaculia bacterium]|nr:sigma-70 family RNA polymerase sigma factor [Thermoanaerobaculia bacterium]
MSQPTDTELVLSTRHGDREAFCELVRRYQRPLYNGAYRITLHAADAGEATQTAFVKAFTHLDRFDTARSFFSWIYRILVHESLDLCAQRRRFTPYQSSTDVRREPRDPERELEATEVVEQVRRALGTLSPDHRTVIALRHYDGLSYREIADLLELDETTVKSRLYEARQRLRDTLAALGLLGDTPRSSGRRAPG